MIHKKQTVKIGVDSDEWVEVDAIVYGDSGYAIHPSYGELAYTITHINSGGAIHHTHSLTAAFAKMKDLKQVMFNGISAGKMTAAEIYKALSERGYPNIIFHEEEAKKLVQLNCKKDGVEG